MSQPSDVVKHSLDERTAELFRANQQLQDLLGRLEASKQILERERVRDQALLTSLGEGLIVIDEHGMITSINPRGCETLGYAKEELLGQWFPKALRNVDAEGQPVDAMQRPITQALSLGRAVSGESYYVRKDETIIPVHITVSPVLIDGKPVGAVEVFRDVTNERALDRAKDEFVSLASHQLRTPATAVKAILSMMVNGDFGTVTPRQKHFMTKALETNNRQLDIIEDLLSTARIDAGKMSLDLVEVDIAMLAGEVVREQRPNLKQRRQTATITKPAEPLLVRADLSKMRMVIDNLVNNAGKYTPPGGRIKVALRATDDSACLIVADTGVGITPEDINHIFQKFSRVENQLSAEVGGTGLGLYLAKHIVDLHKGTIRVSSKPGLGTEFTVELPRVKPMKAGT